MSVRILVADALADAGLRILQREPMFQVDVRTGLKEPELVEAIAQYDGLIVRSTTQVTAPVLIAGTRLRIVGRAGIGVDNIDVATATRSGVVVVNTPMGNVHSAAEHALALLMSIARNVVPADRAMRDKRWEKNRLTGVELTGKTLGIIGLGKVGGHVARVARALGMGVIAHDPFLSIERARDLGVQLQDLNPLLEQSDFISIHVPLNDKTYHMIGPTEFRRMRKTARLVNCSRGGVIDEEALVASLKRNEIAGAALDVFEREPLGDSPLLHLDNVILTPHLGASTEEAQVKVSTDIAEQFVAFFRQGTCQNAVNLVSLADKRLAAWVELCEKLGGIGVQIGGKHLAGITVRVAGEIARKDPKLMTIAAVRGALAHCCGERVNLVNAILVAEERGVRVTESVTTEHPAFVSLVTVEMESEAGVKTLAGVVKDETDPHIVRFDRFEVDLKPARHMLVMYYPDRPGMVGKFGTILGNDNINIARMEVGRTGPGGQAVVLLTLDGPVPSSTLDKIRAEVHIQEIFPVLL